MNFTAYDGSGLWAQRQNLLTVLVRVTYGGLIRLPVVLVDRIRGHGSTVDLTLLGGDATVVSDGREQMVVRVTLE